MSLTGVLPIAKGLGFSRYCETNAPELMEYLECMFARCNMHNNVCSRF